MLKMIYYVDLKTEELEPFVVDDNCLSASNLEHAMMDKLMILYKSMVYSKKQQSAFKELLYTKHYFDLLRNGHTYMEIEEFLKQEIEKKGVRYYVTPLMEQRQILFDATLKFTNGNRQQGLKEFYNYVESEQLLGKKRIRR